MNDLREPSPHRSTRPAEKSTWIESWLLKWVLFGALLWTWPFPLLGLEGTWVPVARFVQLAVSISLLILLEGAGGKVAALFGLLWAHALIYGLVLFGAASILVRQTRRRLPDRLGNGLVVGIVFALFIWAIWGSPYDSQFHHSNAHASFLDLYR